MMSIQYIRQLSDDAARKAAKLHKLPYAIFDLNEIDIVEKSGDPFPFPFLGTYVPPGYRKVEELFCDSSGFGSEDEPAMTKRALLARLREDVGAKGNPYFYAIIEVGQFQCYLGVFEKTGDTVRPPAPGMPKMPRRGRLAPTNRETPKAKATKPSASSAASTSGEILIVEAPDSEVTGQHCPDAKRKAVR